MKEADRIDYKLLFDRDRLRECCLNDTKRSWVPLNIPETGNPQTDINPYDFIYCKYDFDTEALDTSEEIRGIFKEYSTSMYESDPNAVPGRPSVFRGVDRLKLIHNIITSGEEGGCGIDTYALMKDECILGYFPLHDNVELRALEMIWLNFFELPWHQRVDDVKDYFGEKIGLYFLFLGHYTSWLAPAAVMGFLCWVNVAVDGNDPNAVSIPYFGALMAFWSSLMLEYWKRKEKDKAMKWGMIGFEEEEEDRPQFEGTKMRSPVHGKPTTYFAKDERSKRMLKSAFYMCLFISGLIVVVLVVIACIFALRVVMSSSAVLNFNGVEMAGIIASILNALQIQVSQSNVIASKYITSCNYNY